MDPRLLARKKKLIYIFSSKLSKIINGGSIIKFLDISGFNPMTFTGVRSITPTKERSVEGPLLIPVVEIEGIILPIPIVVRPQHYENFISFLQWIVTASPYCVYVFDILSSIDSKLQMVPSQSSSPKIENLPSPLYFSQEFSTGQIFL